MNLPAQYFADTAFWIALFRRRDQFHSSAVEWQKYLVRSEALIVTTEAVCWEWMNAMSGIPTRNIAARGFTRIQLDPQIEVISHGPELNTAALRLYADRADKEWSLTDCLSFVVMGQRGIREALSGDAHFEQAGFRRVLSARPPE